MSDYEPELLEPISQSKVKIIHNTKGVFWEISVVEGADPGEVARLREIAETQHEALAEKFPA